MTKVGFVTSPLRDANSVRGVGFYTKRLLEHIVPLAPEFGLEILQINNLDQLDQLEQLEILHYPFFDLFYPTLPVSSRKTVVTIHDVIPLEFPRNYPPGLKGWLNLQRQKYALKRVSSVITDSRASAQSIHKFLNIPPGKISVIHLAAGEIFQPVKNKKLLTETAKKYHLPSKFVLYVGDVNWNKNIPNLILACQEAGMHLVMVGKQASQLEHLDTSHPELAHLTALKSQIPNLPVIRLGFVPDEDLVAIYNLAHVYCQPSFAEGFGLPVLEALACGTPVACSRTHSLPEIGGEVVNYFDPRDIGDIARAISQPAPSTPKDRLSQAAKFSWEKTAIDTLQVYRQLL